MHRAPALHPFRETDPIMIPTLVVLVYLALVLYIGIFAFRRAASRHAAEDYFLAGRSLGPFVFLFSLFGTNMTAFTILGASGHAFNNGIVTYGLMGSSSALIIPLTLLLIGTRTWALGKKHGFMTPVQMFRDRWECSHIGTAIFALQALFLVPYIIIAVKGGGTILQAISGGWVPYWMGGSLVALVVMSYVFFGGMRGTAWVNTFQTTLFLSFGVAALLVIGAGMGGFSAAMERIAQSPALAPLLTRENVSPLYYLSYTFIPLSAICFPHIGIFCLTARRMSQFRKTVILYPICIMAIWLPCVFLGVAANGAEDFPRIQDKQAARQTLATSGTELTPERESDLRRRMAADDVIPLLLDRYAPLWLAGILGAGIMAAVMASDSQILALSTMFTEDIFAFYGGKQRFGDRAQVQTGRLFVALITSAAFVIALKTPATIFLVAVQYSFTGYAALLPLLVAALFWKRSTRWGALATTLWAGASVGAIALLQAMIPPPSGPPTAILSWGQLDLIVRTAGGTTILGFLPVVPIVLVSALLMIVVSWMTARPGAATIERYFPSKADS
ncbi:MAG: sodium:solute symporter family protein [Acidobacteriota bacterium]|nr:sodium:solute symporter family protein [Acidobacteriota bacterium]